ncbi:MULTISPECIES: class I SAM-dependent methyltransferase [unclassified Pseudoalteromonas]|uniref:class I SAM-dependent methyltransferase n=1 Tax=unclassified Pseudoalteromonas TaxID=194690 RepID=UPI0030153DCC
MTHWQSHHATFYEENYGELQFHRDIPALAGVKSGYRIVELGCGGGFLSCCLVTYAEQVQVIALDPTSTMIDYAIARQKKADICQSQLKFVQAGAEQLDVAAASIDLVIAAFSVHHWQQPIIAMRRIYNSLKPGAKIWLCEDKNTPSGGDLKVNAALKTEAGIKQLLTKVGFVNVTQSQLGTFEGEFAIVSGCKPQ